MREPRISYRSSPASVSVFFASIAGRDEWTVFFRFRVQVMLSRDGERVEKRTGCVQDK